MSHAMEKLSKKAAFKLCACIGMRECVLLCYIMRNALLWDAFGEKKIPNYYDGNYKPNTLHVYIYTH